tara:strand:+ start:95 stop:355 length:261 start_codon:yes stop_codon:yes gene_type:complete
MASLKAQVKIACREILLDYPNYECSLDAEHDPYSFHLDFHYVGEGSCVTIPRYNDEGDPLSDNEREELLNEVRLIVDEHNTKLVNS